MVGSVDRWLAASRKVGGFFYASTGSDEGQGMRSGYFKLRDVLASRADAAGLRWQAEVTPGAVHETNVRLASPTALRAYFAGRSADAARRPAGGPRVSDGS